MASHRVASLLGLAALLGLGALGALAQGQPAAAAASVVKLTSAVDCVSTAEGGTTLDFENASGIEVGDFYAARGVRFPSTAQTRAIFYANTTERATSSPPTTVANNATDGNTSANVPLTILFDQPQAVVGMYLGNNQYGYDPTATLTAFDLAGAQLGSVSLASGTFGNNVTTFLGIELDGGIRKVTLDYGNTTLSEEIDDLCFGSRLPVDQSQLIIPADTGGLALGGANAQQVGQTVTAGVGGRLTHVSLPVACGSDANLVLEIRNVFNDTPYGLALSTTTYSGSNLPSFFPAQPSFRTIPLVGAPPIAAGERFAIVLGATGGSCAVFPGPEGNPYPGGSAYYTSTEPSAGGNWLRIGGGRDDIPFKTHVLRDTTPPAAALTGPAGGTWLSGTQTLTADATDDLGVAYVEFSVARDGALVPLGRDATSPYALEFDSTTVPDGQTTNVYARAVDLAGNSSLFSGRAIWIDNTAPSGTITRPAADDVLVFDSVLLGGNVGDSPSGAQAVTFAYSPAPLSVDYAAVVSPELQLPTRAWTDIETVSAPGSAVSATWDASLVANGEYDLRMTVVDRAGNETTAFRRVTVDNKPAAARLVVAQARDVDSLDPALAFSGQSIRILRNTCTTLYTYPVEDGEVVGTPRLSAANAISVSNLGRTYTFTLRPDLTFETGEAVVAASYERAFLRLLAPATSSQAATGGLFDNILGAKEYRLNEATGISGIEAREDGKLSITLVRRSGGFPALLASANTCPVPLEAPAPSAGSIIPSSGPYKVLRRVPGHQLWLGRNEAYTGPSAQNSADIVVNILPAAELVAEVESGRADLAPNVEPLSERSRLDALYGPGSEAATAGGQRYFKPKTAGTQVIVLNQTHAVLSDPLVRRAIDIAVRRGAYAGALGLPRTDQVLPEPMLGYVDVRLNDEPGSADIAEARELVSQANAGSTALEILVPSGNAARVAAANLLADDLRAIGLNPSVSPVSSPTAFSRMAAGEYQIGLVGWFPDAFDPFNFLHSLFHSSQIGKTNFQRTNAPELDAEIVAADELSGVARYDAFTKLDHKASSGYGLVPYANGTAADFYGEDVGCQVYDPVVGVVYGELCSRSLVSNITLDAAAAVPAGASAVAIGDVPFAQLTSGAQPVGTELGGIELGGIGLNGIELGGIELGGIELGGIALAGTELGGIELGGIGLNQPGILSALSSVSLSSIQLTIPGGWPVLLAGTSLQGVPLQNITLAQVIPLLSDPKSPQALQGLRLGQMSLAGTELGGIELGGIVLGGIELGGISLRGSAGAQNLADWCDVLTTAGYTACDTETVGSQTLVGLAFSGIELGGIELGGIELGGIGLAGTELGGIELGGIELGGIELGGIELGGIELGGIVLAGSELGGIGLGGINLAASELGGIELGGISNVSSIVDCSLVANCGAGTTLAQAQAAGAISATATLADLQGALGKITLKALQGALTGYQLEDLKFYGDVTLADIQALLGPGMTLGMLLQALLDPADLPWESMNLNGVALQLLDPSSVPAAYTARFSISGAAGAQAATEVSVTLPQGFLYVAGSSTSGAIGGPQAPIDNPVQVGRKLTWDLTGITVGAQYEIHFRALPGLRLGVAAASALATPAGGAPSLAAKPANTVIEDTFEPNNDPLGTPVVTPNVLYFSYTASGDDVDYFKFPTPAPGSRINVYLSHLDYDADLVLYSPERQQIVDTATTGVPLDGEPVLDAGLQGQTSLSPEALADVPVVPSLPLAGFSVNRGTGDEQVRTVAHASSGFYRIQVSGYNGASSTSPYMLRVEITQPVTPSCTARALSYTGTTQGTLPASWTGLGLNTVFIFNRQRFGATFTPQAATDTLTALQGLAGRSDLGVSGAVVQVDGSQAVRSAYATWDQNPCSPNAANDVVGSIADIVEDVRAANPNLENVVLVGADDVVPMARIPDLTQLFNEIEYASTFSDNQYFGSLATQSLLSDDPYGDRDPLPYLDRQLFIPDEALGRLVETPDEIQGLVARFQHPDVEGRLAPQTAAVTRYDFLTDGGDAIAAALTANGLTASGLTGETWNKAALDLLIEPAAGNSPDVLSLNAHYDHKRSLPALGNSTGDETDLYSTPDLPDATLAKLQDGIAFTMGCHAGLNVSDVAVGATELDWPQAYARQRAASYFANSGFGLGDTDVVAYTERLMEEFAKNLDGTMSLGRAAVQAKQEYFLGTTPYGVYDEKVMSQTIFYGLPMYQLQGGAVASAFAASAAANVQPDPATQLDSASFELDASTSPSAPQATTLNRRTTPRGTYFDADGGVQVTHYRPIQPSVQIDVSAAGYVAHDALVLAAESIDETGIDPVSSRPIVDLSANEPEPTWQDVAFPTKLVGVNTASGPGGPEQRLNVSLGQFFDDGVSDAEGRGVQRLYTRLDGLVYYNASDDHTAPDVLDVQATVLDGTIGFTVRATDGQAGADGIVRAYVLFRDASGGIWKGGDLTRGAGTDLWTGGFAAVGNRAEYNVQVVDAHGNVGVAAGKDIFIATASPPPPPSIGVTISGNTGNGEWYLTDTLIGLESRAGSALEYSVDGGEFESYQSPFVVSGDAVHRIEFRSANGREGNALVAIDTKPPTIAFRTPKNNSKQKLNDPLEVDFECADTGSSGVAACTGTRADGTFVDTTAAGSETITVNATDIAGNAAVPESRTFSWFADTAPTIPGTPTLEGSSPNRGLFRLAWLPSVDSHDDPITYSLRHKDANDVDFSTVAAGLGDTFFQFALPAGETEGTWTYDVAASDAGLTSAASAPSAPVKVDQTPPNAPNVTIDGTPTLVGAEVWYADGAVVRGTSTDPNLADGSPGSGVVNVTGPVAVTTSGANPVTITATDAVDFSTSTSVTVNLDVNDPTLTLSCLTGPVYLASNVGAAWSASDPGESGIAGATSGVLAYDTATLGAKTTQLTVSDNVGHPATAACSYTVIYRFGGFFSPVANEPTLNQVGAGRSVPLKFSLNGDQGLAIVKSGYPVSQQIACDTGATVNEVAETSTAGSSSLTYDASKDQYSYVWKTASSWAGTCRVFRLVLVDGTEHRALFRFK